MSFHFSLTEIIKSGYDFINAASERVDSTVSVEYVLVSLPAAIVWGSIGAVGVGVRWG